MRYIICKIGVLLWTINEHLNNEKNATLHSFNTHGLTGEKCLNLFVIITTITETVIVGFQCAKYTFPILSVSKYTHAPAHSHTHKQSQNSCKNITIIIAYGSWGCFCFIFIVRNLNHGHCLYRFLDSFISRKNASFVLLTIDNNFHVIILFRFYVNKLHLLLF